MKAPHLPEVIEALRALDTPTVSNAVERFNVRSRSVGYMDDTIRCYFPDLGVLVGYAVTVTISEYGPGEARSHEARFRAYEALRDAPKPTVAVFEDVSPKPRNAAFWGEVQSSIAVALGAKGVITDGVVRDLDPMRANSFKVWAAGTIASHGDIKVEEVNLPVVVGGLAVRPGDLLHADQHGVVLIPPDVAPRIPEAARAIAEREAKIIGLCEGGEFSLERLRELYG